MLFGGSPLSHRALAHPVTAPPRGEPSVPASITAKFVVRKSRKKGSSYHKVFLCPRAYTWLSLRESWREAPERGASHACGTAQLRRCLRQKQPKRSRGSGLLFASPQRRAQQKQGTATIPPPAAERAKNAPSMRGQQKSARLCGRFEMFALYRMFVPVSLQARKGRRALYSLRRATTGSFLAALREGIRPEIRVSRTLMPTRTTAAGRGSTA